MSRQYGDRAVPDIKVRGNDKLPRDVVRKEYSESRHALSCLNCGLESEFAPRLPDSIGEPLYVMMVHACSEFNTQLKNAKGWRCPEAHQGLILHITTGHPSLAGQYGDFNDPNQTPPLRSAHFLVDKDGTIWQLIDTNDVAFAVDGVFGGPGVDNHWISVENIASYGEALTDDQVDTCAQLYAWLARSDKLPLALADTKADRGLGYHRIFSGMSHPCPGDKVIAQRQAILDLCSAAYI